MTPDKRKHPRILAQGVNADITVCNKQGENQFHLTGSLVDISYSGLRIKLNNALPKNLSESNVIIALTLPNSNIRCRIKGQIKHLHTHSELGLQYLNDHEDDKENVVDDFMFECVKGSSQSAHSVMLD